MLPVRLVQTRQTVDLLESKMSPGWEWWISRKSFTPGERLRGGARVARTPIEQYGGDLRPESLACHVDEVRVVREKQNLGLLCQLGENPEARRGALIVVADEQVVRDKGQWNAVREILFDRGNAQREIKLVARAGAQSWNLDPLAAPTNAREVRLVVLVEVEL